MRYKVDFENLEEEIIYIENKNKEVIESTSKLSNYKNNLTWESENRNDFDNSYDLVNDKIKTLTTKTNEILSLLKKKYNLFSDVNNNQIKNLGTKKSTRGGINYDKD